MARPTIYLETSVPSDLVARPSRNLIARGHQLVTRRWWRQRLSSFDRYVSAIVLEEVSRGDKEYASRRLEVLASFPLLERTPRVERLAETHIGDLGLPDKAMRDAVRLAFACGHEMEFVVSWNCAHIANAGIRRRLAELNVSPGVPTPVICTPEELLYAEEE